jgi:hypothetical protein
MSLRWRVCRREVWPAGRWRALGRLSRPVEGKVGCLSDREAVVVPLRGRLPRGRQCAGSVARTGWRHFRSRGRPEPRCWSFSGPERPSGLRVMRGYRAQRSRLVCGIDGAFAANPEPEREIGGGAGDDIASLVRPDRPRDLGARGPAHSSRSLRLCHAEIQADARLPNARTGFWRRSLHGNRDCSPAGRGERSQRLDDKSSVSREAHGICERRG